MKTQDISQIGVILKRRRREIRKTQDEIAAESGLSQRAIMSAELWFPGCSTQAPTLRTVDAISRALDRFGAPSMEIPPEG